MMRLVICQFALIGLARAVRAKGGRKDEAFAWPWDRDSHHAVPHHLGGLMSAHSQVHHQRSFNTFDSSSSDFSTDSGDSSSSGGDFMDQYITETGQKPMQVDDDKPKVQKQEESIPDMATLFSDKPETPDASAQPQKQEPWRSQSTSSDMDNLFGGSFSNFNTPANSFDFDAPKKPARHADSDSSSDDMTKLFGGVSDSASSSPAPKDADTFGGDSGWNSDSTSGWPWNTHANKKESEGRHSRDLWSSSSASSSASSSGASNVFVYCWLHRRNRFQRSCIHQALHAFR